MILRTTGCLAGFVALMLSVGGLTAFAQAPGTQTTKAKRPPKQTADPYFKLPAHNLTGQDATIPNGQSEKRDLKNPLMRVPSKNPSANALKPQRPANIGRQPRNDFPDGQFPVQPKNNQGGGSQNNQMLSPQQKTVPPQIGENQNLDRANGPLVPQSRSLKPNGQQRNQFSNQDSVQSVPNSGQFDPSANAFNPPQQEGKFAVPNQGFNSPIGTTPQDSKSPTKRASYDSIEPDSVGGHAKLMGPREIEKLPAKVDGEFFEPGATLAVVGGEPIFAADLLMEANQLVERFMAGAPDDLKQSQRKLIIPKLLNKYVESKLIYVDIVRGLPEQSAMDQILETLGDHFDREMLPKIIEKNKVKSAAEFDTQLRAQGVSLRQFRQRWMEEEFVRYFLKEKIVVDPDVNHQEILDYYRANEELFRVKERARWEQIVISFAQTPDRKKARAEIAKLGNEVVYGAPLDAVAKRGSQGLKAKQGGQQGWVNKGSLVSTELDEAVFTLPMNRLSDIIETDLGFHIIRVLERTPSGLKPFRDAQIEIKEKLKEQKRAESFKKHLEKLRREIPVEILIEGVETNLDSKSGPANK